MIRNTKRTQLPPRRNDPVKQEHGRSFVRVCGPILIDALVEMDFDMYLRR